MRTVRPRALRARGLSTIAVALAAAVTLTACGSDDPDPEASGTTPPASTSATTSPGETTDTDTSTPPTTGTSPTDPTTDPTETGSEEPPDAVTVSIEVTIAGGAVETALPRVPVSIGQKVLLFVTSDVEEEVHVHGIEKSKTVKAGKSMRMTFRIKDDVTPGLYVIEGHNTALQLLELEVS